MQVKSDRYVHSYPVWSKEVKVGNIHLLQNKEDYQYMMEKFFGKDSFYISKQLEGKKEASSNEKPKSTLNEQAPSEQTTSKPIVQNTDKVIEPVEKTESTTPVEVSENTAPNVSEKEDTPAIETAPTTSVNDNAIGSFEQQVVDLTNAERAKNGLAALKIDSSLMATAEAKSLDMSTNSYFSHTSPNLGSPFDQMKAKNISYKTAGENIAMGQRSPQEVVDAWMKSPGHRANILNSKFTHIGVGFVEKGSYWTQQFIGK
ncbi:hypothetical protein D3873_05985 [Paenisporosarcina cavernae]|uniref:SCP domain-containing protein n=2 Tax=Paenisporosarcina cavernae TaxID=2320858 RepID=A0A385YV62_9BACL|nr:hypothetical protein D3873_05985 [Paenisporosarcina cavernae]